MGLVVAFAVAVIGAAAGISAVLAGGGTTQLVIALAIHFAGTLFVLVAVFAALDSG
jgi:hypothetical protein